MSERFDPYHRWLGIPPEDQPPHHYRLLGIAEFEADREVIDSVAMRHISFLQDITDGPYLKDAQRLLNELAAARRCLLDPNKRAAYDAQLRERLAERIPAPPPAGSPAVIATNDPATPPVIRSPLIDFAVAADRNEQAAPLAGFPVQPGSRTIRPAHDKRDGRVPLAPPRRMLLMAVGAVSLVVLLLLVVWLSRGGGTPRAGQPDLASRAKPRSAASAGDAASTEAVREEAAREGSLAEKDPIEPAAGLADEPESRPLPEPPADESRIGELEAAAAGHDFTPPAPLKIDGLLLWLDASDPATLRCDDASGVLGWSDKSGGGFQAESDDAAARPRRIDAAWGEKPIVEFGGAAHLSLSRTAAPFDLGAQYTLLYVARGARGCLLSKGSGESPGSFALGDGVAGLRIGGQPLPAAGDTGQTPRVRVVVADTDGLRWFVDGQSNHTDSDTDHAIKSTGVLRIGCVWKRGSGAEQFFQGQLAELLIYDRALDDTQRVYLEDYLAEKWLRGIEAVEPLAVDLAETTTADSAAMDDAAAAAPAGAEDVDPADRPVDEAQDAEDQPPQGYVVLTPNQLEASGDSRLQVLDGGIVLADGSTRENEQVQLLVEMPAGPLTALRLEALPHESLPAKGPGWAPAGRFALSELRASVQPSDGTQPAREIGWTAVADDRDEAAKRLVDGIDDNSWTVRRRGETVTVTLLPKTPVQLAAGDRLNITIRQRENLGCFRLLATGDADPLASVTQGLAAPAAGGQGDDRFALFVNLGGDSYEDDQGNTWQKSKEFAGQQFGHENGSSAGKPKQLYPRQPWAESAIRGLTAFRAVVPNGTYEVTLCFCEQWTGNADNRRFYAVLERGTPRQLTLPFHGPGGGGPWTQTVPKVLVQDGTLDIDFSPFDENSSAILNAIVIRQTAENPRPPRGR